jgi:WD40 repeat protein
MPILSIDAQPNGFRFVTGGSDHKVCIWNLLPGISLKYENPPSRVEVLKNNASRLEIVPEEQKHLGDEDSNMLREDHKV